MSRPICFLLCALVFYSCGTGFEEEANAFFEEQRKEDPSFDVPFALERTLGPAEIQHNAQFYGRSRDGQVRIDLLLQHTLPKPLVLEPTVFTLHTPGGNYSQPFSPDALASLERGKNYRLTLFFQPIHDRRFFMRTGMNGDLNHQYALEMNVPGVATEYHFEMADTIWSNYPDKNGIENEVLFFQPTIDWEAQQAYQKVMGRSEFVHTDENEMAMAGVNVQLHSYHWRDTLYLNLKLVNHSNDQLYVHPTDLRHTLSPLKNLEKEEQEHTLRKSQRFIESYRFYRPAPIDSFMIPKTLITFDTGERLPLLADHIYFHPTK